MAYTDSLDTRPTVSMTPRRGLSLLAVASLFVLIGRGTPVSSHSLLADTFVVASGLAVITALAITALMISDRHLPRLDAVTLGAGLLLQLVQFAGASSTSLSGGTDETLLNRLAMRTLLAGHNPYTTVYNLVGADGYGTPLLGGGQADRYQYPPLELEIGRVIGLVSRHLAAPSLVGAIAVLALAVGTFLALPTDWRPLATVSVLGLGLFEFPALTGESVVLAMALLGVPLWRWTSTGARGRLGCIGVLQAIGLGLAVSAGQLAWFVAPFLVLALALVRRGELGTRGAAAVLARYVGLALVTAAVVNAPFIVAAPGAWARAMASTLTQHAIVAGSGWALPAIELHGGSGRLDLLGWSSIALFAATWLCFGAWFRRCARALAVVPSLAFLLSSRSDPTYLFALVPLWLVVAATSSPRAIASARPLRLPRPARGLVRTRAARLGLTLAAAVPAVALFLLGVTGPPPVGLTPIAAVLTPGHLETVTVDVRNLTGHAITPQYFIDQRSAITHPWIPLSGSRILGPHGRAVVVLRTRTDLEAAPVSAGLWIFATIGSPGGLTATRLMVRPENVTVRSLNGPAAQVRVRRACLAQLLSGQHYDCSSQLGLSQVR